MLDEERRSEIRSRVAAQRDAVTSLRDRVVSPYLKGELTLALNLTNDVETVFLNSVEDRTPAAETAWLDGAEVPFTQALSKLQSVEKLVAARGVNAQASDDPPR